MELIIEGNERLIIVRIVGTLDSSTCRMLRDTLLELSAGGRNWIRVDLSETSFVDTVGVGVLLGLQSTLRGREGDLAVVSPQSDVLKTLERLRVDSELMTPRLPTE